MHHLLMLPSPTPPPLTLYETQTNGSLILKHLPSSSPIMSAVLWRKLLDESLNDGQVCHSIYFRIPCPRKHPIYFTECAHDHADLGAALNGFSLNETGALSGAIEKTGQAVDATYMSTTKLVRSLKYFHCNQESNLFPSCKI